MKKQNKCCGSCRLFPFEDTGGWGICEAYDILVHCGWKGCEELSKKCKYWDKKEQKS